MTDASIGSKWIRTSILEASWLSDLSIKDVPEAVAERLRQRAARNHRSLQGELMAIVEQAAAETGAPAGLRSPGVQAAGEIAHSRVLGWKTIEQAVRRAQGQRLDTRSVPRAGAARRRHHPRRPRFAMSTPGRSQARIPSTQCAGSSSDPAGRPKGEHRRGQPEGTPLSPASARLLFVAEPPALWNQRPAVVADQRSAALLWAEPAAGEAAALLAGRAVHAPELLLYELLNVARSSRSGVPAAIARAGLQALAEQRAWCCTTPSCCRPSTSRKAWN
ncbi:MAG: Arc family DNA-binding protein [Rubrivivax sp.]